MLRVLRELIRFVRVHQKPWLIPVLVVLALLMVLIVIALKSGAAPRFIYTLI